MKIYPSLISSDVLQLKKTIEMLDPHCDGYHIDVMDDHFVPNLTWGPVFVKAIMGATRLPVHLHLMVDNPECWIDRVALRKEDVFIFHHEAVRNEDKICALIKGIKKSGCLVGAALNPETAVEKVFPYLAFLDYILLMSVRPGFSGQKFIPEVLKKVSVLKEALAKQRRACVIGMDGGVSRENIGVLKKALVDEVGVASAIFATNDPVRAIKELKIL